MAVHADNFSDMSNLSREALTRVFGQFLESGAPTPVSNTGDYPNEAGTMFLLKGVAYFNFGNAVQSSPP